MQLRKLVLACGFASFALSNYVSALGLGEVKLNSTLNQPLNAEIKLLEIRDLSAEQILVALASPAEFERNGIDRLYFYNELQFQVDLQHAGGPIVRVTTRNAVREPYLNFLIEARWTSGRLLREYTVLMDLPTFDTTAPKAVNTAQTTQPRTSKPQSARASDDGLVPASARSSGGVDGSPESVKRRAKVKDGTYGPIDKNDTLWDIAKAVRPDARVTVNQTMMALQRLNPQAFIRGNINLLKRGQVLKVPDVAEAADVSIVEARNQVATHATEWSGEASSDSAAQLDASVSTNNTPQISEAVSGRVKLEAPSADTSANGLGSGADQSGGSGLDAKLSASLEELDKAKSENTELTSRVQELEEQIKTMQKLTDVSNEKMRALQLVAAKQGDEAAAIEAGASANSSAPAVAAAPAKKTVANTSKTNTEKSIVTTITDNLLWILLAIAGLVMAIFLFLRNRKDDEEAKEYTPSQTAFPEPEPSFERFNTPVQAAPEPELIPEENVEAETVSVVAETDDVVSEAGIYISLGKYQQAEEMLLNALNTNNTSTEVYLKLLEVYSHTQNITEFDKQYAALWPLATPIILGRAAELRSAIQGAGNYPGDVSSAGNVVSNEENSDLSYEPVDGGVEVASNRYDLDFSKPSATPVPADAEEEEFIIEFDDDKKLHPEAEDLTDISSALDSLDSSDNEILPADIDVASLNPSRNEFGEISFDAGDLELESTEVEKKDSSLSVQDDGDFSLEMDMKDVDLAALDLEMDKLYADDTETQLIRSNNDSELSISDDDLAEFDALFEANTAEAEHEIESSYDISDDATDDVLTLDDAIPYSPTESPLTDDDTQKADESPLADLDEQVQILNNTPVDESAVSAAYDEGVDEAVFNEAMSDFSAESLNADVEDMADEDVDAELDFMVDADEAATKLDLARAYLDMGDSDGARDILAEVAEEGNEQQREEAVAMLARIDT